MARPLKNLHVSKCLDELQNQAKIKVANNSVKSLISSADKLYAEAEKQQLAGDEELSYIYYYRYLEAISVAQKKEDFKKEKAYYEKLISRSKFKGAVDKLEKLTKSLEKRYDLNKQANDLDSAAVQKEYSEALQNEKNLQAKKPNSGSKVKDNGTLSSDDSFKTAITSLNGIVKTNGVDTETAAIDNDGITPHELKNLLEQKTKRLLLVDCRDKTDFTNNHIDHSYCICIPAVSLSQGMSASRILNTLKECSPESYMDWNKRGSFDYIILYDWNSSFEHRSPGLNIVYDALTKWDQECKNAKILIVLGGMKNMYYTYPSLLTHPQTNVNAANKSDGSTDVDLRKLESISYPDLEDAPQKPKNVQPNSTVNLNNTANHDAGNINNPPTDVPKNNMAVTFDRTTKPSRYNSPKVPNGTAGETSPSPQVVSKVVETDKDKTEAKAKEYAEALDTLIESTKHFIESENEVRKLTEHVSQEADPEMAKQLRIKDAENESLRKQLDARNDQLMKLKVQYEIVLREQKEKHILPKIRTSAEEEKINSKVEEKQKLDEAVKQLRKARLENERVKREQQGQKDKEQSVDPDGSKLPPISNAFPRSVSKVGSATNTTQLPAINNSIPAEITPSPVSSLKPSSSNVVSSHSRPVSQDSNVITRQRLKDENSDHPRSTALKRSHSHPNIAQSHDEDMSEDLPESSQVPRINRGLKPAGNRAHAPETITPRRFARNFEVVSSTERSKTGLKNLGNTCYMNSIIQCLSHTNKLVDYLRNEEYIKEWHPSRSPTKGEATEELAAAVKQMHSGHRSISLLDLKSAIGKHHRSFRGYEQQDSHEFITILLDWLHEEMNRVAEKTPLKEQKNDGLSDEVAAMRAWDDYKKSNDSKISELFCGQQKSCVTCASCSRQSVTFEPFFILSVPIPSSGKRCDIQQCIDFYTTEEELSGWQCVHCKKKVRATKKIDLWRLPPYLIIHFQRFYFDGYWKKRLTEIDFPVENLNLNQKVLAKSGVDKCPSYDYQLYGVSNHYGSMDGGHYTAYCRLNGNWWKFDDQEVCPLNGRDVPTAAAYIMFYQNRNC